MNTYTAELAAWDHIHELISLKQALVVAKARQDDNGPVDPHLKTRLTRTIAREMADLAIILDNWVVRCDRPDREAVFEAHGNKLEFKLVGL